MSVIRSLSFTIDGEYYAVDIDLIEKIIRKAPLTPVLTAPKAVVGMVNLHGKAVTVLSIAVLLGRDRLVSAGGLPTINAVIFKDFFAEGEQMGIEVAHPDDLLEIEEAMVERLILDDRPKTAFVSGLANVEGKTYRMLDIFSIIDSFRDSGDRTTAVAGEGE